MYEHNNLIVGSICILWKWGRYSITISGQYFWSNIGDPIQCEYLVDIIILERFTDTIQGQSCVWILIQCTVNDVLILAQYTILCWGNVAHVHYESTVKQYKNNIVLQCRYIVVVMLAEYQFNIGKMLFMFIGRILYKWYQNNIAFQYQFNRWNSS